MGKLFLNFGDFSSDYGVCEQTETLPRRNQSLSWICSLTSWPCSFILSPRSSMCAVLPHPTVIGNKFVQRLSQGIHLTRVFMHMCLALELNSCLSLCLHSSWFKFQPSLNYCFFGLKIKSKKLFKFEGGWAIGRLVGLNWSTAYIMIS